MSSKNAPRVFTKLLKSVVWRRAICSIHFLDDYTGVEPDVTWPLVEDILWHVFPSRPCLVLNKLGKWFSCPFPNYSILGSGGELNHDEPHISAQGHDVDKQNDSYSVEDWGIRLVIEYL